MKPVMKDAPRQARRERTLTRLEVLLKGGVKTEKPKGVEEPIVIGPLSATDVARIQKDVSILKQRLGRA